MNKTDYHGKMDALVNDKQTYEELKRDPTPILQRKLNSKILTLKKTDTIDTQRYYRLRSSVPQPNLRRLDLISYQNRCFLFNFFPCVIRLSVGLLSVGDLVLYNY